MADARPEPDLAANPGQARQLAWPGLGQAWHSPAVLIGILFFSSFMVLYGIMGYYTHYSFIYLFFFGITVLLYKAITRLTL